VVNEGSRTRSDEEQSSDCIVDLLDDGIDPGPELMANLLDAVRILAWDQKGKPEFSIDIMFSTIWFNRARSELRSNLEKRARFRPALSDEELPRVCRLLASMIYRDDQAEFAGAILALPGEPTISRERWSEVIAQHPALVPAISPGASESPVGESGPAEKGTDEVRIMLEDQEVGSMGWAEDESEEIFVFGDPARVIPLALQLAERLGGRFVEA
jgi:hypothetical protein